MKKLEIAKTKIAEKVGKYNGKYAVFNVFYGNYVTPMIDNDFIHFNHDEYTKILEEFLNSKEGREYERPSEEQILNDEVSTINSEVSYLASFYETPDEFEVIKPEPDKTKELLKEKERDKYYLKVKLLLIASGILTLAAGCFGIILLNIY